MKQILVLAVLGICALSCKREANIDLPDGSSKTKKDSTVLVGSDPGLDTTITDKPKPIDGTPDWRDPFIGKYEGISTYTSWALEREDKWTYTAKIQVDKDYQNPNALVFRKELVTSFPPGKIPLSYFEITFEYRATLDKMGYIDFPNQEVSITHTQPYPVRYLIKQEVFASGQKACYGKWKNDTLMLVMSFQDKDMRDSMIVVKK